MKYLDRVYEEFFAQARKHNRQNINLHAGITPAKTKRMRKLIRYGDMARKGTSTF